MINSEDKIVKEQTQLLDNRSDEQYSLEEYRMLRTEILQYLEEYQNVRNMMYLVTVAMLAFGVGSDEIYLLLLPLIVIIPSYKIAIEYCNNVNRAASYLHVFYETQTDDFPIKWETRIQKTNSSYRKTYSPKDSAQFLPYRVSMIMCHMIYFVRFIECNISNGFVIYAENHVYISCNVVQLLLGIITAIISIYVEHTSLITSIAEFDEMWKKIG